MIRQQFFKGIIFIILSVFITVSSKGQSSDSPLKFNIASRYQTGLNSIQTTYADLDGDGFLDIISVNGGQENPNPTVTILYGTGNGKFSGPIVLPSYMIGHTVTVGDLNKDGKPEIVIASWYQNGVAVFLNQGNRQFASPVFSIPPDPPYSGVGEYYDLAIADFDGDGNNDVVGLEDQQYQRLRFFHFNAAGSLTVFATINQFASPTSYEAEMVIGDVNGDHRPDVVWAGGGPFYDRNVSFVFGQPAGGSLEGTFGFHIVPQVSGIKLKDLDNDGDNDMVIAYLDGNAQHSIRPYVNNGSGTFTEASAINLDVPFPPQDITTGDFNNDGKQDIAALVGSVFEKGSMVLILNGKGDCTFTKEKFYAVSESSSIFSADINQDQKSDILTASDFLFQTGYSWYTGISNNSVSVLLNEDLQSLKVPLPVLYKSSYLEAADFNNDGFLDFASAWGYRADYFSAIELLLNDKLVGFLPDNYYLSTVTNLSGMTVGDFNGDGNQDALTLHTNGYKMVIYLGNGDGTLGNQVTTNLSDEVGDLKVGDFNSDGKDDVFIVDYGARGFALLSNGNGTFSVAPGSPASLPTNEQTFSQTGDVNGDGKLDLIISRNSKISVWLGDGAGRFDQNPAVLIPQLSNYTTGDFNGDGKVDLVGMTNPVGSLPPGRTDKALTCFLGDGSGGFPNSFSMNIKNFTHSTVESLAVADLDLDGFDDVALIMADNKFGNLIVVPSGGNTPVWKQPIFYGVGTATRKLIAKDFNADGKPDLGFLGINTRGIIYNATSASHNATFDYDGDGKSDVSVFRPSNGIWYLLQSQAGFGGLQFGQAGDKMVPADYDGDGKTDVAVYRAGTWFIQRSSLGFTNPQFGAADDIPVSADFDGDGKTDLAVYRASNGTWFVQRSRDGFYGLQFGVSGDRPVAADFDGDGKADFAVFRPSSGIWYVQQSTAGFGGLQFGSSDDKLVVADYDGDGKADFAVFRPSTGIWYLQRSQLGFTGVQFGQPGDIPVAADYDGDGRADIAVYRNDTWLIQRSAQGFIGVQFGSNGDLPAPSAFVQ